MLIAQALTQTNKMLKSSFKKHTLYFKRPGGTSRGILTSKDLWLLEVWDDKYPEVIGIGECSIIYGLSPDPMEQYEEKLLELTKNIHQSEKVDLSGFPSIIFGLEMAIRDLQMGGKRVLYPSDFTAGRKSIPINGLVWMGSVEFMREQIIEKLKFGFDCIKLKIGAIDFEKELSLFKMIRREFKKEELELRVDANGAFQPGEALEKLKRLSDYTIHSIEQPIKQKQWHQMSAICDASPIDIALDEELIGLTDCQVPEMLDAIHPHYLILKPSLLGGFSRSELFISEAQKNGIGWWVTSALESNVGLNAIAQWTATLANPMPQGLGTGSLFTNNFTSPLEVVRGGKLEYRVR